MSSEQQAVDPYRPPPPPPPSHRPEQLADLVFAGAALLFVGFLSVLAGAAAGSSGLAAVSAVLASLVMPVALYWRRSHPVASSVVIYATALSHYLLGANIILSDVLVLVALYSVTVYGPVWAARTALAGGFAGQALQGFFPLGAFPPGGPVASLFTTGMISVLCLLAWALGLLRRSRLAHTETLAERARRLEIERDQQAQIATAAERSRIAREMHDVVAHSLSVVIAQADGGRYAAATDPQAAVRALTTISETGRAALADMRKILGVLRAPDDGSAPAVVPQPIDADIDALVAQVRSSGLSCSVARVGQPRPLPPGAGLTVYRICQEALTNVLKHGGPSATVTVLLQWGPQQLVVQIDDTGRGAAATSDGAGHGILGMRERVDLFAGTLQAGPRPGGGFRVRAVIPLPRLTDAPGTAPLTPAQWPDPSQEGSP